jgi:hypothetical protein
VAREDLLDLLGEPVAAVGEPVEFFGQLADDPAGRLLVARECALGHTSRRNLARIAPGTHQLGQVPVPAPDEVAAG